MPADLIQHVVSDHETLEVFLHTTDVQSHSRLVGLRWQRVLEAVRGALREAAHEIRDGQPRD